MSVSSPLAPRPLLAVTSWTHLTDNVIGRPVVIAALIALAIMIRWVLCRLLDRIVQHAIEAADSELAARLGNGERRVQRARTMGDLLKSVVTGILVAVFGTMVLGEVGINIAPIIAGAGIVGVALGFGAQSLVKDFLSGIFMIFEDQYGVGDQVDVGVASGTVEAVSLRVTRLRGLDGTVWYVPNGTIARVGNKSQNWSRAVIDVQVAPDEDLVRVQQILREIGHDLWVDDEYDGTVIEEPEVTGVEDISPEGATVRLLIKTAPTQQAAIARDARQRIKARFDAEGIHLPQRPAWPAASQPPG